MDVWDFGRVIVHGPYKHPQSGQLSQPVTSNTGPASGFSLFSDYGPSSQLLQKLVQVQEETSIVTAQCY
jgi:hypothetical protein